MDINDRKHQARLRRYAIVHNVTIKNITTIKSAQGLDRLFTSPKRSENESERPMSHQNTSPHQKGVGASVISQIGTRTDSYHQKGVVTNKGRRAIQCLVPPKRSGNNGYKPNGIKAYLHHYMEWERM